MISPKSKSIPLSFGATLNKNFEIREQMLEDFFKISSLASNSCFFCYKDLSSSFFCFRKRKESMFVCSTCIVKVALTEIMKDDNITKEKDLSHILDLVLASYSN